VDFAVELEKIKQMHELNQEKIKQSCPSDSNDVIDLSARINALRHDMNQFEVSIGAKLDRLSVFVSKNSDLIDELDQDRPAKHIIVQGLPESPNITKSLHDLMAKIGLFIPPAPHVFIDAAHRLGKERSAAELTARGPRPILVKFNTVTDRDSFYHNKKQLKGSNIFISEYLTPARVSLLKRVKDVYGATKAWKKVLRWKNFRPDRL
jgi:outer membrane murein-binding lipoprotein Lpp